MISLRQTGGIVLPDGRALFEAHLEAAGPVVVAGAQAAIDRQRSPSGKKWRQRTRPYPWPTLRKSNTLYNGFRLERNGDNLVVTNEAPYSGFHQEGAPEGNLPARGFFPVNTVSSEMLPRAWQRAIEKSPAVLRVWRGESAGPAPEPATE